MRVHLVKKRTLMQYAEANAKFRSVVRHWLKKLRQADWYDPADLLQTFGTADLIGNGTDRVVFDFGDRCRMVCHYVFGQKEVHLFVCWIGTHAEYDELCRKRLQYFIKIY